MCDISNFSDESRWLDLTRLKEEYDNILIEAFITTHLPFRIALIIGEEVEIVCIATSLNHPASFVWISRNSQHSCP
jgi:hypothetical protein